VSCNGYQGVNIGTNNSPTQEVLVPQIGANSVVNENISNQKTVAGVPGQVIKNTGTESVCVAANKSKTKEFLEQFPQYEKYLANQK